MTTEPADLASPHRDLRASILAVLTDGASLRSWTLVANDGIIATAGILEGFAGAGATDRALLIAATVATIAGMLAAGGAKWAEIDAEREAQIHAAADEAASLAARPEAELEELAAYYEAKGLAPELALEVAEQLSAHNALAAQLESEHGILEVKSRADVVRAGAGSVVAYALGAAIPLLITLTAPVTAEARTILVAVLVSLTVTSIVGARTGHMNLRRTLTRTLVVGISTMGVSYLVGKLLF